MKKISMSFLINGSEQLADMAEIYYSEDFKNFQIRKPNMIKTSVRLNEKSNLLEIDFDYEDIPKDELKDFFHSMQLKKKYFRLKNGSFIDLNSSEIDSLSKIMENLNISGKTVIRRGLYCLKMPPLIWIISLIQ